MSEPTALTTPAQISSWVVLSRIHQLALEINTGLPWSRVPMMTVLYREGILSRPMRGTRATKKRVLAAMVEAMHEANPHWSPSASVTRALGSE